MIPSSERARLLRTALALLAGNALYSLTVVLFLVPSGLITDHRRGHRHRPGRQPDGRPAGVGGAAGRQRGDAGGGLGAAGAALRRFHPGQHLFIPPHPRGVGAALCRIRPHRRPVSQHRLGIGGALGLVIRVGGSTGGMDIPPLVLQKYFRIPVAVSMTVFDLTILFAQAVSSPRAQVLYGVVLVFVYSTVLDKVILLGTRRTEVKLVSTHTDELRSAILSELDRGVTLLAAEGGYLRQPGHLLLTVISHRELPRLERLVHAIDPACFMVVSEVTEVRGRGFSLEKDYRHET